MNLARAAPSTALLLSLLAIATIAPPLQAQSAPTTAAPGAEATALDACFSAFGEAQKLRRLGELLESRERLIQCGQPPCPEAIVDKCSQWLREVDRELPTVVIAATDGRGLDTVDVQVFVDGELRAEQLDGLPLSLDPGVHTFRFVGRSGEPVERRVLLTVGERARRIEVTLASPRKPKPPAPPEPQPVAAREPRERWLSPLLFIGFGVGAGGIAVGTATGILAINRAADLAELCPDKSCSPERQEEYDDGATLAHVSTISFIVAAGGLVAGTVGLFTSRFSSDSTDEEAEISATLGLGHAGISGRF